MGDSFDQHHRLICLRDNDRDDELMDGMLLIFCYGNLKETSLIFLLAICI